VLGFQSFTAYFKASREHSEKDNSLREKNRANTRAISEAQKAYRFSQRKIKAQKILI
jgi:hypothetical protein